MSMQDAPGHVTRASLFAAAFGSGERWLDWFIDRVAVYLDLAPRDRHVLELRQRGLALHVIAPRIGVSRGCAERSSRLVLTRGTARGCATPLAAAIQSIEARAPAPARVLIREVDPGRTARWRAAVHRLGPAVALTDDPEHCDVTIDSPWSSARHPRAVTPGVVVLSSTDPIGRMVCAGHFSQIYANPDHDDLLLVLALAVVRAANVRHADTAPLWPLSSAWLRESLLDHLVRSGGVRPRGRELVDAWIDAGDQKTTARRLHLSARAVESRASRVCASLGIRTLGSLALGAAATMDRLDSTRLGS